MTIDWFEFFGKGIIAAIVCCILLSIFTKYEIGYILLFALGNGLGTGLTAIKVKKGN